MTNSNSNASGTPGFFFTVLFLIILVLKLAEIGVVANWSWWAVTAPLWGPFLITLAILVVMLVVFGIKKLVTKNK